MTEWCKETEDGLDAVRRPTFEEYCATGKHLARDRHTAPWKLIDWVNIGEKEFGEEQPQAFDIFNDWEASTVMNILSVGRNIKTRKYIGKVSFEHHRTVAKRHIDKKEQEWLLQQALDKGLTVVQFRRLVKGEKPREPLAVFEYHVRRAISSLNRALEAEKREPELMQTIISKLLELVEK
jgi:hypothetical protein